MKSHDIAERGITPAERQLLYRLGELALADLKVKNAAGSMPSQVELTKQIADLGDLLTAADK